MSRDCCNGTAMFALPRNCGGLQDGRRDRTSHSANATKLPSDNEDQWRIVVKLAGRAANFHLWLNIWDCRPDCFDN